MAEKLTKTDDENHGIVSNEPRSWWHPFENLRHEIDRVFDDFNRGGWLSPFGRKSFGLEPFWRHELSWGASPAVDIVEKDMAFEIEVELPGMDEKDIEVSLADDMLTIRGEKTEEKEEKKRKRTTVCQSGAMARSNGCSAFRQVSIATRSRRRVSRVC
ncbi:MAG TPA: Hsp20/alpha crystallin family protein [Rhodocyclaceae bacterium]|nr:Hsp20/alpha crystallin family protein [Rhodocyclaceae bacterium]